MIKRLISAFVLTTTLLSGCNIYRLEVQQGNYLSEEQLAQVSRGMSQGQVRELLGMPLLADDFHRNRWDYVFYKKQGDQLSNQQGVTIFFNEQGLVTDIRRDQ